MSLSQADINYRTRCDMPSDSACALMPLCKARIGNKVKVARVGGGRGVCARMAAMGIYPGAVMRLVCSGCVRVNGAVLTLGDDISSRIFVTLSA